MFVAFLTGALETEGEQELVWMAATNDANEGGLGAMRVFSRKNPTGSLDDEENQQFLRIAARERESSGLEHKLRLDIAQQREEEALVSKLRKKAEMLAALLDALDRLDADDVS